MFKHVGLIGKHGDERVVTTLHSLVDLLAALGLDALFDAESARALPSFGLRVVERRTLAEACDVVIIVGGDGTFLSAARSLIGYDVRLLGVNLGRLGFLTDISPAEVTERLREIFSGAFEEEERTVLHTTVLRGGKPAVEVDALNEAVIHKWNIARLIEFETYINSRLVNTQRSDGLIVSTPTGSTAYALSGGGPILYPTLDAVVIVPICPHTLSSRPIVVDGRSHIEIVIHRGNQADAQLTCDGQTALALEPMDRIVIRQRDDRLHLVHPPGHDYFATLRAKLHWGREL